MAVGQTVSWDVSDRGISWHFGEHGGGARVEGKRRSQSVLVVCKPGCTLESLTELLNILMPRSYPVPIMSSYLGMGARQQWLLKIPSLQPNLGVTALGTILL